VRVVLLDVSVSDTKTYTLTILETPRTLELQDGTRYTIGEDGYLIGVTAKTTSAILLSSFKHAENVRIYKADGAEFTDGSGYVGTGSTVSLILNGEKVHTVTVVVLGDVGGDGEIGTNDYTLIRAHYLEKKKLEGVYLMAARVTGQETVGSGDYIRVRAHYLEKLDLYA
jgi:hypothetical protein